jgi:tRNA(Ile)-lysidine synthase
MKPFAKVRRYIDQHAMFEDVRGVVVAVSGGPDSIALLDMLMRWIEPHTGQSGERLSLYVAHLNHQLRGADSDKDAEFVRRLAERLSLPVTIECADVRAAAESSRRGIEETAREIRYDFLLRVARATGADRIAAGHTMSDQAETFLMRMLRGAGTRGLAAMRPICAAHEFARQRSGVGGRGAVKKETPLSDDEEACLLSVPRPPASDPRPLLIRPLLAITREEVEAYCNECGLDYKIDATNIAGAFTRNRVRRDVLPALRAINPQAVEAIARASEHLAADEQTLDSLAVTYLDAAHVEPLDEAADEALSSVAAYRIAMLRELPAGLQRRMLIEAIRRMCMVGKTGAHREITAKHVAAVSRLLEKGASGKRLQLPGGLEVWRELETIIFKWDDRSAGNYLLELSAAPAQVEAGGLGLAIERGLPASQLPALLDQAQRLVEQRRRDWLMAILDDEALSAVLIVRPRRRGQRVRVSGHCKTIKLKKLMIDHTIPASRRSAWPVVMTTDERYVWSPGLPPAVDFAAHGKTRTLAIMRALNL